MGGQPPARGPDPAHEGLASGPPPCSAITLQSGPPDTPSPYTYKMHCIIHQEAPCAKPANLVDVMTVVVKVVNSILSCSLNHCQFQALVDEVGVQYGDLLYFCKVRWLSRGAMLSRVCDLHTEIATFLRQKNLHYADHFFDPRWLARLALVGPTDGHHNAPERRQREAAEVRPLHGCGLQPVYRPLLLSRGRHPSPLQMELVELQCNDELKAKFYNCSPLSFFRNISLLGIFLNTLRMFKAS